MAAQHDCSEIVELDDDDVLLDGWQDRFVDALKTHDAAYADYEYGEGKRTWKPPYQKGIFKEGCLSVGVRGYTVKAWRHVGEHNKYLHYAEDYDLFIRFDVDQSIRVAYIDRPVARVDVRGDGHSTANYPEVVAASRAMVDMYYGGKG